MRESILAVTFRPESVKLLRLTRMPGRIGISGLAEATPPPQAAPADQVALAANLVEAHGLGADRVILGIDAGVAVLRRLRFPFTAKSKIDLVLGPEFEPHLAGPLAETALAWVKTALEPAPATVALAAAHPLAPLLELTDALTQQGLPPAAACLDLAGLDAVAAALADTATAMVVSVTAGRADFVCRLNGEPLAWRSLPVSGDDPAGLASLLAREALLTLSPLAARPPEPLRLLLAGEAVTDSVATALADVAGAPPLPLSGLPGWPRLADGEPLPDAFAAAYGLALLAGAGPGTRNFLRGPLAPAIPKPVVRRGIAVAGGSLVVLVLSGLAGLIHTYGRLDAAIDKAQNETSALVEQAAPELASGLTLTQKLSVLRGRLAEQSASARERGSTGGGSALEVLAAIHNGLGQGGRVVVRRIAADDKRVTIDATADDYNTVEEVKRRLAAMPLFQDVEIRGAKNVPDKNQVEFQLDIGLTSDREAAS